MPVSHKATAHSNRSFKPQLEDIKSSYLLLNKLERNERARQNDAQDNKWVKPFDDVARRQQLMEAKRKFQSSRFKSDSKYDKIEGLNWISWK